MMDVRDTAFERCRGGFSDGNVWDFYACLDINHLKIPVCNTLNLNKAAGGLLQSVDEAAVGWLRGGTGGQTKITEPSFQVPRSSVRKGVDVSALRFT